MLQKNDKQVCFGCKIHTPCGIYHIVPHELGGTDVPQNLIHLCKTCHDFVIRGFAGLQNLLSMPDGVSGGNSCANRETRLLSLVLIQLIALWAANPEEAHDDCKTLMWDWLAPEHSSLRKRYSSDDVVAYGYKYLNRRLLEVHSEYEIISRIRWLSRNNVSEKQILQALDALCDTIVRRSSKTKMKHNDPNQIDLLDSDENHSLF